MSSSIKISSIFLVLLLISSNGEAAKCSEKDISITQTGVASQDMPHFSVTITNECACPQSQLVVTCKGFETAVPVSPKLFTTLRGGPGGNCLVNAGKPIVKNIPVVFDYAWLDPFGFELVSSTINS